MGAAGLAALLPLLAGCNGAVEPGPRVTLAFDSVAEWTVGVFDEPAEQAFAGIADAAPAPSGGVVVLDELTPSLSWFDSLGRLVDRVAGKGAGPGELSVPRGLDVADDGTVAVLDARNLRLSIFRLADGEIRHLDDVGITLLADDLCRLDHRFVINGRGDGTYLHFVEPDGTRDGSFAEEITELGQDARTSAWFHRNALQNDGFLACGHPVAPIIFAHREIGYGRAFDRSGRELWRTSLGGFHRVRWQAVDGGRRMQEAPDPETGTVTYTMGVALGPESTVLVGTYETWVRGPVTYRTYVLSVETGEELAAVPSPFILFGYRDGRAYGRQRQPFPRVSVRRMTFDPRPERR